MKLTPDTLNRPRPQKGQLELPLTPPATRLADVCRYCHSCHMNVQDFIACREANT